MKKIYIVLTYTGTILSKIIKMYTRKEYSHVSISLDENLESMYSFGRKNAYNPFWGGFVRESTKFGTFKRFKRSKTKIYSLEVSDEDYSKIKNIIDEFNTNKDKYSFNVLGLIGVCLNYKVKRVNSFYCTEFVKYVLENTSIKLNIPDVVKVDDFEKIKGSKVVYIGHLNEYKM